MWSHQWHCSCHSVLFGSQSLVSCPPSLSSLLLHTYPFHWHSSQGLTCLVFYVSSTSGSQTAVSVKTNQPAWDTQLDPTDEFQVGISFVLLVPYDRKGLLNQGKFSDSLKVLREARVCSFSQGQPCLHSVPFCKLSAKHCRCAWNVNPKTEESLIHFVH